MENQASWVGMGKLGRGGPECPGCIFAHPAPFRPPTVKFEGVHGLFNPNP